MRLVDHYDLDVIPRGWLPRPRTRLGGRLPAEDKSLANRKNRRQAHQEIQAHGEDADVLPKLWTERDVL